MCFLFNYRKHWLSGRKTRRRRWRRKKWTGQTHYKCEPSSSPIKWGTKLDARPVNSNCFHEFFNSSARPERRLVVLYRLASRAIKFSCCESHPANRWVSLNVRYDSSQPGCLWLYREASCHYRKRSKGRRKRMNFEESIALAFGFSFSYSLSLSSSAKKTTKSEAKTINQYLLEIVGLSTRITLNLWLLSRAFTLAHDMNRQSNHVYCQLHNLAK